MKKNHKYTVFFDFDHTITQLDVLDKLFDLFAEGEDWRRLEEDWLKGKIGSKECLLGQMESVRVTKPEIDKFLQTIKLDPGFKDLLLYIKANNYPTFIVSDSFDFFIDAILKHHGVNDLKIYANNLRLEKDTFKVDFLNGGSSCHKCANCKKEKLNRHTNGSLSIYIGDGFSDTCAAEHADIVFAKDKLLEYGISKGYSWLAYKTLQDVKEYLETHEK